MDCSFLQRLIEDFELLRLNEQQQQQLPAIVASNTSQFLQQWVASCLDQRCLARCIQTLLADKELLYCYYPKATAILRQSNYATALMVCLTAIQLDQRSLLHQLEWRQRRSSSQSPPRKYQIKQQQQQLRRYESLPSLKLHLPAQCLSSASSSSNSSGSHLTKQRIQLINCDDIKIWTDESKSSLSTPLPPAPPPAEIAPVKATQCISNLFSSLFSATPVYTSWYNSLLGQSEQAASLLDGLLPVNGRKLDQRRQPSLFEGVSMLDYNSSPAAVATTAPLDIGSSQSVSCSSTPYSLSSDSQLDKQSLTAFLQMSRCSHNNNTQLEKENAHFAISEACIAAIEHVKWRRHEQQQPIAVAAAPVDVAGLLLPYASDNDNDNDNNNSAEAVGLQLISRFNDQQLPKLCELKWLVSEQDAPQQLLPLPKPQQQQQLQQLEDCALLRGTQNWAPPRQQIIFTEHAPVSRSQLLQQQHYRCAGCGMQVTRQYQHHFRYCNYLGKYLCTGCHRQQLSAIPAKILQSWDFHCYPVSSFAYRLIEQMYTFPLFHVPDLNARLYAMHKVLARSRRRRQQLQYVKDFIGCCRYAKREQEFFAAVPLHITNEPDLWSMCDFVDVQNYSMIRSIEQLITLSEQHVNNCVLCLGRAFVCEYCKSAKLIFPWQRKVQRCDGCGACAHYKCWKSKSVDMCLRCERLQGRLRR
ncbi:run domain Beclin-1-interacting and cysteine-rich domain-containing protein isoform X2 [Drosophila busckii]|uniref:run domain Beclin-1-interacting and cysteine-rich domain-containing protein isoform X2 n=1 Tax=Drosophila busckii TaxID=30019 RepID=UPI00083F4606|nr:run domain Beclin-1-interacting and cysteine-rich domain-containing protein isoform X2 [Drosophila busckii]